MSKSVLVVEDDEILRGAMRMVLQWEGYRVACAGDGRQALDLLRSGQRPSCILLDLMLPVCDGWQFCREQQRDPALAGIPVVVVSGHDVRRSLKAAGHVRKPFQPQELLAAMRGVVREPAAAGTRPFREEVENAVDPGRATGVDLGAEARPAPR